MVNVNENKLAILVCVNMNQNGKVTSQKNLSKMIPLRCILKHITLKMYNLQILMSMLKTIMKIK